MRKENDVITMPEIKVIDRQQIEQLITMKYGIDAVQGPFRLHGEIKVTMLFTFV